MTIRIGIYVGADWLACVAVARQGIIWHGGAERLRETPLESQLAELLRVAPVTRLMRPAAFVVLGPALAHVKQLRGLPPVTAPRVIRQLIQGTPSRFFLVGDGLPVIADPQRSADGWWIAMADAATIAAVHTACARRGLRLGGTRPVATLLHRALAGAPSGARIGWVDGDVSLDIICGDHGIASLRREPTRSGVSAAATTGVDAPLEKLGTDAWRFAGAYAAARAGSSAPLLLRQSDDGRHGSRRIALRVASIVAVVVGTVVMLAAPGVAAARARSGNDRAFDALRSAASSVARERIALEQQQAALRQIGAFVTNRRLVTPLLSALSIQLPESTAIVALRLDTLGATFIALSPIGTALVPAVSSMPGVEGLQLSAPITRETIGPLELQRTALRFRFMRRPSTSRPMRR